MFALPCFDVSGFLEVVYSHFGEFYFLAVGFPLRHVKRNERLETHWPDGPHFSGYLTTVSS